ncbi:hypothetical protein GCM10011313_21760 [Mycetocola zhadangensis]|nr:hypothetical protein GCM10011313_21760 [Mycetocola zhadangensis]
MKFTDQMTKRRGNARLLPTLMVTAFLSASLVGFGVQPALAGTAQSANGYFTAGSTQYYNYAFVSTSTSRAYAATGTSKLSGSTPAGWAGSRGRLFNRQIRANGVCSVARGARIWTSRVSVVTTSE